jgi:hypothetical protein
MWNKDPYKLNANTNPRTNVNTDSNINNGHGLGYTKWKGCHLCFKVNLFFNILAIIYLKKNLIILCYH